MGDFIAVEAYRLTDQVGRRVVIRDSWLNEPREVIAVDYQVADLDAVACMWATLRGLPRNDRRIPGWSS